MIIAIGDNKSGERRNSELQRRRIFSGCTLGTEMIEPQPAVAEQVLDAL
ncbi:hypothetical protein LAD67_11610 [Escherichia coli]|nr:hypothetical protein [Escherichia coli]